MEKIVEFSSLKRLAEKHGDTSDNRHKPPQKPYKKYLAIMSVLFVLLLTLVYLQIPVSHISTISVKGASLKEASYYLKQTDLQKGESLWGYRSHNIEQRLEAEKTVHKANVKRQWPNEVVIEIEEQRPMAYIRDDQGRLDYVLDNGEVLRLDEKVHEIDMPIMTGFADKHLRKKTVKQLVLMDEEMRHTISEIKPNVSSKNENYIKLFMTDGYEVRANVKTLAKKLNYYPEMVKQVKNDHKKAGIFNLEVGEYFETYKNK